MLKRGTLVIVDWGDAEADSGWGPIKETRHAAQPVHSVGYVLYDNEECITLAADVGEKLGDEDDVNRSIVIPKGMISKVKRLQT